MTRYYSLSDAVSKLGVAKTDEEAEAVAKVLGRIGPRCTAIEFYRWRRRQNGDSVHDAYIEMLKEVAR